jgi:hypothetical protein
VLIARYGREGQCDGRDRCVRCFGLIDPLRALPPAGYWRALFVETSRAKDESRWREKKSIAMHIN